MGCPPCPGGGGGVMRPLTDAKVAYGEHSDAPPEPILKSVASIMFDGLAGGPPTVTVMVFSSVVIPNVSFSTSELLSSCSEL